MIGYRVRISVCLTVLAAAFAASAFGQAGGVGLNPARMDIEVGAGQEKTVSFEIESPPSDVPVRGQLLLSLTDWDISEGGTLRYVDPGTLGESASNWVVFSPSAVSISSGQSHQVRVTVRPPRNTQPGVYRTALFVQERPPAAPPGRGQHVFYVRRRYVFTLYVIVGPVRKHAEVTDLLVLSRDQKQQLQWEMKNVGTSHVRPLVSISVRDKQNVEAFHVDRYESMVLLPGKALKQAIPIPSAPPGEYVVSVQVDFQDGRALQSLSRTVRINEESPGGGF